MSHPTPHPGRPVPAVIAILPRLAETGAQVLLVRRDNPPDAGFWGFPGGKMELGETLAAATLRELKEETGITARAGPVLGALDVITHDDTGALQFHYVLVATLCHWICGAPQAGDDVSAAAWVSLDQMRAGLLPLSADVLPTADLAVEMYKKSDT